MLSVKLICAPPQWGRPEGVFKLEDLNPRHSGGFTNGPRVGVCKQGVCKTNR